MKAYRGRIVLLIATFVLLFGFVPNSSAQATSMVLTRRNAIFTIQTDNRIDVHETWDIRFIGGPFDSATYTIPLNRVDTIGAWSLRLGDREFSESTSQTEYTFTVTKAKNERSITWFFPPVSDTTLSFDLFYQLEGALQVYEGGDQLLWAFIEAERAYPIEAAQVTVIFPSDLPQYNILTTSYLDNVEASAPERIDERSLVYRHGPFEPGQTWKIRVQVPHGLFPISEARWQYLERMQSGFNLIALTLAGLIGLGGLLAWLTLWLRSRRIQPTAVVAEYLSQPPDGIAPALAGLLLDGKVLPRHLIATLVDLTRRNQLWINRSGHTIEFQRPSMAQNGLHTFERQIFEHLFGSSLKASASVYGGLVWRFTRWRGYLIDEAIKAGYWRHDPEEFKRSWKRRARLASMLLCVLGMAAYYLFLAQYAPQAFWVVIAATAVGLLFGIFSPWSVQRSTKGDDALVRLQAFKRYLINIKRYTELDKANEQFERYLPYAVAFGLEEQWIKTFSEVQIPTPSWFANVTRYNAGLPQGTTASLRPSVASASASGGQQAALFGRAAESKARSTASLPSFSSLGSATINGLNTLSTDFFMLLNDASRAFSPAEQASAQQSELLYGSNKRFWNWLFSSTRSSSSSAASSSRSAGWSSSPSSGDAGSKRFD